MWAGWVVPPKTLCYGFPNPTVKAHKIVAHLTVLVIVKPRTPRRRKKWVWNASTTTSSRRASPLPHGRLLLLLLQVLFFYLSILYSYFTFNKLESPVDVYLFLLLLLNIYIYIHARAVGESPPKVFVGHSIYKGKAALTIEPRAPEFSPLEVSLLLFSSVFFFFFASLYVFKLIYIAVRGI